MKMLAFFLVAGLMACPLLVFSQQEPLFQFILHFEDNIGNRDSVILGYDPSASSQNINTQFGENFTTTAFDSIFEVRCMHGDDGLKRTLKKVIEETDILSWDSSCALPFYTKIIINAKYPPVKITYDSTLFPFQTCANVILSPDRNIFFLQEWWDVCEYHCMSDTSAYWEDFTIPYPPAICFNRLFVEKEVEGQGLKMLPGLFFMTFYGPGPCNDSTFLNVGAKEISPSTFGILSPNPVKTHFSIPLLQDESMTMGEIRDISGRRVSGGYSILGNAVHFEVSHLLPGLYFVILQTRGGTRTVYRFVKE